MKRKVILETIFASMAVFLITLAFFIQWLIGENPFITSMFALAFIIGGYHKAKEGLFDTMAEKRLNVEFLMILAALAAFIIGNYSEGAILILIFSISGVLESYANARSEKALKSLLNLAPETAVLYENSEEKEVPLSEVVEGNILIVKVGQKVPVDSIIVEGDTAVDQAAITGEFVPAYKHVGDKLYAGAINLEGSVLIRATKSAGDSVIQKIVAFVQKAQADQPKSEARIKRFERYYVYCVILFAILMMVIPPFFGWLSTDEAIYRGIIVLVVGSPCALVASISPAVLSVLSNASRAHILIKGGSRLEGVNAVKAAIFDKTGTITTGEPQVLRIESGETEALKTIERMLYTLEQQSNHPLAKAIVKSLSDVKPIKEITTKERPGYGMEATYQDSVWKIGRFDCDISETLRIKLDEAMNEGHTSVHVIKDDQLVAFVVLKDTIRPSMLKLAEYLHKKKIHTVLMTGDNDKTAQALGEKMGIDSIYANCFPENKVTIVNKTKERFGHVLMVGDGINDAPALTQADVSVAMGTATDVSLETADIVFIDDNLLSLTKVFKLSRRLRNIIRVNVTFSVLVIVGLMIGNVYGQIQLPFGVLVHELSTIGVILNSLRLLFR